MAETKTYTGSCHCGKIRYEVTTAPLSGAMSCNCSICSKRGTLMTFVPLEQLKLLSGEDGLSDYQFGKKSVHHLFCRTCGVAPFGSGTAPDGKKMYAVNVRCLDGVDVSTLAITSFDGKSL